MNISTQLSKHFSLAEATYSITALSLGLDNIPVAKILETVKNTALCLERVRTVLTDSPIQISSWYRSPRVNQAVGSKFTSQHIRGEAVDFTCPLFGSPLAVCKAIIARESDIKFDQLILEHTWVHISFAVSSASNRGQVLSLLATGKYASGLTNRQGQRYE